MSGPLFSMKWWAQGPVAQGNQWESLGYLTRLQLQGFDLDHVEFMSSAGPV